MPILDGHASADRLPDGDRDLLNGYADELAAAAVKLQRETGLAINEMLAFALENGAEVTVGVGSAEEVRPALLSQMEGLERVGVETFLARPVPLTHLRIVTWTNIGVGCFRVDTVPPAQTGAEA